jgi:exopolysaccharide production protein ExoQ
MKRLYFRPGFGSPLVLSTSLWIFISFLGALFFFWTQDISHSVRWQGEGLLTVDESVATANQGPHGIPRGLILFSLGSFATVSLLRRGRNSLRINGWLGHLIIFFLIWAILSVAWADDSVMGLKEVINFSLFMLGALAVAERFSVRQAMFLAFVICSLFLVIGVFAEISLGTFQIFQSGYRFCGIDDPNTGSWGLAILVLTAVALASTADRHRSIYWAMATVGMTFLLLSRTRTSFAAVILALCSAGVLVKSKRHIMAFILGLIFIVCLGYLILGNDLVSKAWQVILLGGREGPGSETSTLTGRIPVWYECFSYIAKRPLLGYGFNCFWTPQHIVKISSTLSSSTAVGWAFNSYIDLVLCVGFVGASAYVLMLGLAIKRSIFLFKITRNPECAFVCSLLIFYCLVMLTEGIASSPRMTQFTVLVLLAQLAFREQPC